MTNRVILSAPGVKFSRLGFDVLTAGHAGLLFDSSFAGAAKFVKGSVAGSRPGNGVTTHNIVYGKTFSSKPFVMVNATGSTGSSFPGQAFALRSYGDSKTPYNNFTFSFSRVEVVVGLSSMDILFSSASSSFSYVLDYLVMDYRAGF